MSIHVVLQVTDLERSTDFDTRILGFRISDVYPEDMMLNHVTFEVSTLDEVVRLRHHLRRHDAMIGFVSIHAPHLQRGEPSHWQVKGYRSLRFQSTPHIFSGANSAAMSFEIPT